VLLRDVDYFAGELAKRLEGLHSLEGDGRMRSNWQVAAKLARRTRGLVRNQLDNDRRRRKLEARR
jgi:hypothetical protein